MKKFLTFTMVSTMLLSAHVLNTLAGNGLSSNTPISHNNDSITSAGDSISPNADYAVFHIYRLPGPGAFVSYDLHLGDTVLCRVINRCKFTIKVKKEGLDTIWAKTEVKKELPINVEYGKEYYIKCSITIGAFVGHPKIELVDNKTGIVEFNSKKLKKVK